MRIRSGRSRALMITAVALALDLTAPVVGARADLALGVDDGVRQAGVGAGLFEARGIGFEVDEFERVGGDQVAVEGFELVVVEEQAEAGTRVDPEMFVALWADVEVVLEIFFPDDLATVVTLHPETFGAHLALAGGVEFTGLAFEPCHFSR